MNSPSNSKQAFWVLLGSLSAFLFSLISSMILSRYFNKADYGTYKQIIYVYDTLLVVFTLGLPKTYSFFLPRVPLNQAKKVISKINNILLIAGMVMGVSIFLGAEFIAAFLKNENLSTPLKYFALVPVFMLPTIGLEGILATYKKTQLLALYNITTRILMLLCVAGPVTLLEGNVNDAVFGFVIASFLTFLFALFLKYYPVKNAKANETDLHYKEIFEYAIPLLFAGLWGILIKSTDQFFISRYFGPEAFADFSNGALELPFVAMVISAASIVLAPIYSKKAFDNNDNAKAEIINLWHSVFSKTIMLTYPIVVYCFCFSDMIMMAIYGENYATSGEFFQIKVIINFFTLIAYGPLVLSIGGNKFYYKVHMFGALIVIPLEYISVIIFQSATMIVWVSVICQISRIIAMLWFISNYFNIYILKLFPWKLIFKILIPAFILSYGLKYLMISYAPGLNLLLHLIMSGAIYLILFGALAFFLKIDYLKIILPILKKGQ